VHDLIYALGYKQVNLYGVSYGTRLALTVMRLFPDDVRSVILDSTVPTQENLVDALPTATQHAFDTLFQGCAANHRCATSYPQLQSLFYHLVDTLNVHPVTFYDAHYGPIVLNGDNLANWVFSSLYVTRLIPLLPETIVQISQGNYRTISKYYAPLMLDANISYGMYYSVECGEDVAFTTREQIDQATSVLRPEVKPNIQASLQSDFSICQFWEQTPVPPAQKQPVTSSIPTLILAGEYDPITPPSNGELAMQGLSSGYFFLFPGTGHGVFRTGTCPNAVVAAFLLDPNTKPTASCVAGVAEPDFAVAS
jgi:pimeloyl-ACP methyl ester carboxylesterase